MRFRSLLILLILTTYSISYGASIGPDSGLPLPRYASVRVLDANMRNGPSKQYPILWNYQAKGMPVLIIEEHEHWRKVRTIGGEEGWFHISLLSSVRTVIFKRAENYDVPLLQKMKKNESILLRRARPDSFPIARIADNTIGILIKCDLQWCKVRVNNALGWTRKINLWGVMEEEQIS